MTKKVFTPNQVSALNANPNVRLAMDGPIKFLEQFKIDAINAYLEGGQSRMCNAFGNWPMKYKKAKSVISDKRSWTSTKGLSDKEMPPGFRDYWLTVSVKGAAFIDEKDGCRSAVILWPQSFFLMCP
jgi:hypothetical protein